MANQGQCQQNDNQMDQNKECWLKVIKYFIITVEASITNILQNNAQNQHIHEHRAMFSLSLLHPFSVYFSVSVSI